MLLGVLRIAPSARATTIDPRVWEATASGGEADFLLVLDQQADLSAAAELPTREERLRYVYDALRSTALRSQAALRADLDATGVAYRPFYVVNMVAVKGDRDLLSRLARRSEVSRIVANPRVRQTLPTPSCPPSIPPIGGRWEWGPPSPHEAKPGWEPPSSHKGEPGWKPPSPCGGGLGRGQAGVEWNVARINADDVWALGYSGEGIVVAGQDTGYDWDHPALVSQYRGYDGVSAVHDFNWHDAIHSGGGSCGADSPEPCDDHGHGTHTMGTIVGDDGEDNQVGVAPGARWIGCRNMDQGVGTPATYAECFEFFLAPYPVGGDPATEGDPSLAPHVINNSWTCPPYEGCDWDTLQAVVENVRAAGIVVVASAGNSGPSCSSVEDPPAIYDAVFSVGATARDDGVAGFSSRGPVTVDGSGRPKPDVSAPGVGVRSSVPDAGYGSSSGTSMAGPHVAGAVALLWSAEPSLVGDVDATERVLARAARPRTTTQSCGGDTPDDVPNNVYGWGILDALRAVQGTRSGMELAKRVAFPPGLRVRSLSYTLFLTNTSPFTLTQVTLTDTIPLSTTFARASGDYERAGGTVTWTAESLAPWESLTATLVVTVEHLPSGTRVINADYGARASELFAPVSGAATEVMLPWRRLLFPILKNWTPEGRGDG